MPKTKSAPPFPSSKRPPTTPRNPSHEEISKRAKALWMWRGCPEFCDEAIWLEAERQLGLLQEPERAEDGDFPSDPLSRLDLKSDDVMSELEELFPSPTGRETTSL